MATDRTIFRVASRHKPYAQLGNAMLRDTRLSFEARGVLAFILTYPSNWQFGLAWLCRDQAIGRDRARRIIREHVAVGYCQRGRTRNADGTLGAYEYVFTDEPECLPPQPEKASVVTTDGKPVTGQPALANPTPTKTVSPTNTYTKRKSALHIEPSVTDGATGELLPFTADVLQAVAAVGADPQALVERYRERTAGRHITDPSAYLLRMARDEAAKRLGVPAATLVGLTSGNREKRALALAASVGACPDPSAAVLKGVVRRARAGGQDPDELIKAWRGSARVRPIRTSFEADRSLLAFEASFRASERGASRGDRERSGGNTGEPRTT
jgi:hypothetical protein